MGEVLEFLIDGASGLAPGSVNGKAIVAGVCSKGKVGKGYLLNKRAQVQQLLGYGPLTERVQDVLAAGGQNPIIVAVPVAAGIPGALVPGESNPEGVVFSGTPLAAAGLVVEVLQAGKRNIGTFHYSEDGGQNFGSVFTIPVDGLFILDGYGVSITFAEDTAFSAGQRFSCELKAPSCTMADVMTALEGPLGTYDVEFVHIAAPSDAVDWAAAQAKTDELWNAHRPTYFKMESRLPGPDEDVNDFAAYLMGERAKVAARFVQVCCQYGAVSDAAGGRKMRNLAGFWSGRTVANPVQRAAGRVKDGPLGQVSLPEYWGAVQTMLEDAGFVTAKNYAGLSGAYWGDSRTLAEATSDFRYEEVLRVIFKAVRLERVAALKSLYDEAGDPLRPHTAGGLAYLKAQVENALDTMTKALPPEMAAYKVEIPAGQDIANNGVAVECTLIGIPIIRQIKLYSRYVYAGGRFDPRMEA